MPDSPCFVVLSSAATDAVLASAVDAAMGVDEVFMILPAGLAPPVGLPALVTSSIGGGLDAELVDATIAALRPRSLIGDVGALELLLDGRRAQSSSSAIVLTPSKLPRGMRKRLEAAFAQLSERVV